MGETAHLDGWGFAGVGGVRSSFGVVGDFLGCAGFWLSADFWGL